MTESIGTSSTKRPRERFTCVFFWVILPLAIPSSIILYIIDRLFCQTFPGTETPASLVPSSTPSLEEPINLFYAWDLMCAFWRNVCANRVDTIWMFLFFLFTAMLVATSISENRGPNDRKPHREGNEAALRKASFLRSILFLIPISVCFFYLFSFPTIRPKVDFNASLLAAAAEPISEPTLTLISAEHRQALDEIKLRIEQDDQWFHIKFLLVGGLFTLFGSLLVLERIEIGREREFPRLRNFLGQQGDAGRRLKERSGFGFEEVLGTHLASTIFATVFIIAVVIDMHVRTSHMVVHQLANWILTHVDPILNCIKSPFSSYCENVKSPYMPWEQFLRIADGNRKGMHEDFVWNLFQTPHIHFTTWLFYIAYLSLLFWLCSYGGNGETDAFDKDAPRNEGKEGWAKLIKRLLVRVPSAVAFDNGGRKKGRDLRGHLATTIALFLIVHVSLGVFAFIGHTAPGAFYEKLLVPNGELWISSDKAGYAFVIVWLLMTGLVTLRVFPSMIRWGLYAKLSEKCSVVTERRVRWYVTITYVLAIMALSTAIFTNVFTLREREAFGHIIAPTALLQGAASNTLLEKDVKMAVVIEAPTKRYFERLREFDHDFLYAIQVKLIKTGEWMFVKATLDGIEITGYSVQPRWKFVKPKLDGLDNLRLEEETWYNSELESEVVNEICKRMGGVKKYQERQEDEECIKVYFQRADDGPKREEYELPEFTADLKKSGKQLKLKVIVISDATNVWRLKKKEAQVVDRVQTFLEDHYVDVIGQRKLDGQHDLKCIRENIIEAMYENHHYNGCEIWNDQGLKSYDPAMMQVVIKERLVYERGPNAHLNGMD